MLWTSCRHASRNPGGRATSSKRDHEGWTGVDERFCEHHADVGASQLAALLGRSPADVIRHMGALGVEVPPVPLLGDVCPMCGRRMPVAGRAMENGVCDACNQRLLTEMREVREAELGARIADRAMWARGRRDRASRG